MAFFDIVWLLLLISLILPLLRQKILEIRRFRLMKTLEKKRKSRLISLIHRQEIISLFGIPIYGYINIEDSEAVLRAIRMTPDDMPIDLILHTPGGLVLASEQIANALKKHKAKVSVIIPHYAMSGGSLIALSADEIIMDKNSVLGTVDPQLGMYPAVSVLKTVKRKSFDEIDDSTLIMADVAEKAMSQIYKFVKSLLLVNQDEKDAERIARTLSNGKYTHDYPITFEEAKEMGLNVSSDIPEEVHTLMTLYPQSKSMRPSVQYIPVPYKKEEKKEE